MLTRKVCAPCRLRKCLAVGMSPDLIRKDESTDRKRKSDKTNNDELIVMVGTSQKMFFQYIGM